MESVFNNNLVSIIAGIVLIAISILFALLFFKAFRKRKIEEPEKKLEQKAGIAQEVTGEERVDLERIEEFIEEAEEEIEEEEIEEEEGRKGFFARLKAGLEKTRTAFVGRIESLFTGRKVDEGLYGELEEVLITADVGLKTSNALLESLKERAEKEKITDAGDLKRILKEEIRKKLQPKTVSIELTDKPFVIMMVGVNGTGKTTTIGKIAHQLTQAGKSVILAASDTFRAAAVEQLEKWAERSKSELVKQAQGADPAAVAYDAVSAAVARSFDVVIVDTAGRLHTKTNLMKEMKKIKRVVAKARQDAPHLILLVVDANTGQNAIRQADEFNEAVGIDGIILTKLDGTAKGGVIIGIYDQLKIPIFYVGVGEKIYDLRPFDPDEFIEALFES